MKGTWISGSISALVALAVVVTLQCVARASISVDDYKIPNGKANATVCDVTMSNAVIVTVPPSANLLPARVTVLLEREVPGMFYGMTTVKVIGKWEVQRNQMLRIHEIPKDGDIIQIRIVNEKCSLEVGVHVVRDTEASSAPSGVTGRAE